MKTALISVYHKEGIIEFARQLQKRGVTDIIASGGTAKALKEGGVSVKNVAEIVGGNAILGHRVVTMSREVAGGILAKDTEEDRQELIKLAIPWIDLVCVDLCPLEEEIAREGSTLESVVEMIDIGGPAMLVEHPIMICAGSKANRIIVCSPEDRKLVIDWMDAGQPNMEIFARDLAAKAMYTVVKYYMNFLRYISNGKYEGIIGEKFLDCAYGENPWQSPAAAYSTNRGKMIDFLGLDKISKIAGKDFSYNNLCDIDRLLQTITHIAGVFALNRESVPKIAVGAKHGNACGAIIHESSEECIAQMLTGDLRAIHGGVVVTSFEIRSMEADLLLTYKMETGKTRMLDSIVAPSFSNRAIDILARRAKCRLGTLPALSCLDRDSLDKSLRFRHIRGGFLVQPNYTYLIDLRDPELKKYGPLLMPEEEDQLLFAKAICDTSNSNTITLVNEDMLVGNGVGQQDRVGGCALAISRARSAGHQRMLKNSFAASDSFFPFTDGPEILREAGVKAILANSGSIHDKKIIKFCEDNKLTLYLIPNEIARGFSNH